MEQTIYFRRTGEQITPWKSLTFKARWKEEGYCKFLYEQKSAP